MSTKDAPAIDDAVVTRWDRPRWISVFSSHNPTIREVTECLGLGLSASSSTTNRGIPKFDNPDYRKLSGEVTRLSKELPKERDALLDFAADPASLEKELEALMTDFGQAIWGRTTDRSCLLTPDPAKKTYPKHLYYEDPADKEILKIHLHRWIIIKACYYIRNMKLKRPSAAADYDTLADIEADGDLNSPIKAQLVSPNDTPLSNTPPAEAPSTAAGAESSARPLNLKKRKSSVFMSHSDGEEAAATPAKRHHQSHTMPSSRKSPRKSIRSLASESPISENVPPLPSQGQSQSNHFQPSAPPASTPDPARPLLTPLSSNDLNGAARPASSAPAPGGFTAVNTGGNFTAVNTALPSREAPPANPLNPPTHNGRHYSSPYDSSPYGAATPQHSSNPPKAPPLNTASSISHGFQAINSPVVANGVSARNSPVVQHNAHAHLPAQVQHQPQPQPQPQPQVQHQPQPQPHVQHQPQPQPQTQHPHRPTSRSNTPTTYQASRASASYHPPSRSHTPIALASNPQPATSANVQPAPAPAVQHAPVANVQHAPAQHLHHASIPTIPSNVHYVPQPAVVLKSHPHEVPVMPPKPPFTPDVGLLQCEVLGSLVQYLFPKQSSPPDEAALLHKIDTLWAYNGVLFRKQIGHLYDFSSTILHSWISERRKISQLRHSLIYSPGLPAVEMVDRLLAMNDLRVMRLKWKNMSSAEGLSAEDVLCRTFAVITNTEGTEYLFKDGLDRLNESLFDFLRNEDMKILMHKR